MAVLKYQLPWGVVGSDRSDLSSGFSPNSLESRQLFRDSSDTLGPLAQFRFRQIVTPYAAAIAHLASYQTTRTVFAAPADGHDPEQSLTAEAV
jgi:hypothetical protein